MITWRGRAPTGKLVLPAVYHDALLTCAYGHVAAQHTDLVHGAVGIPDVAVMAGQAGDIGPRDISWPRLWLGGEEAIEELLAQRADDLAGLGACAFVVEGH